MSYTTSLANNLDSRICRSMDDGLASERTSHRAFVGISALLFAASAALTIVRCTFMSAMRGMPMPGGWTMSMVWMRMPGQSWPEAAASFIGMWVVMMVAMMLPSLAPMLWGYRQAVGSTSETRKAWLTTLWGGLLLRVDRIRNGGLSYGRWAGGGRDAPARTGAHGSDRRQCGGPIDFRII